MLQPGVTAAIVDGGYFPIAVDVSADDQAYWRLLDQLWADQQTFCVVEQDIVVRYHTLGDLETCQEPWAGANYRYMGGTYAGLGCTRFRSALMALFPDAIGLLGEIQLPNHGPKHFCTLDSILKRLLEGRGYRMCIHGSVEHLGSNWPSHDCITRPEVTVAARERDIDPFRHAALPARSS